MSKLHRGTLRLSSNVFLDPTRGPESAAEVSEWDDFIVSNMAEANLIGPVLSNLAQGAIGCTDYSGTEFFIREPLRIIVPALVACLDAATPHVRCARSCDWGTMQLYVLKKQSQLLDNSTSCVFSNVEDRLVSRAQSWLSEVAPTRETDAHVAEDSTATIAAFIKKNIGWVIQTDTMCERLVHKQPC
jgi:hypothetical protein